MKMKRLHCAEIVAMMLETIRIGAKKTSILQRTYLSFPQAKSYLSHLLEEQMIRYDLSLRLYSITERGLDFLETYQQMQSLIYPENDTNLVGRPVTTMAA